MTNSEGCPRLGIAGLIQSKAGKIGLLTIRGDVCAAKEESLLGMTRKDSVSSLLWQAVNRYSFISKLSAIGTVDPKRMTSSPLRCRRTNKDGLVPQTRHYEEDALRIRSISATNDDSNSCLYVLQNQDPPCVERIRLNRGF